MGPRAGLDERLLPEAGEEGPPGLTVVLPF